MTHKPKQETVVVGGTEYTFQSPGAAWYYEMIDRARGVDGTLQVAQVNRELLDTVVVSPKVKLEDFDTPGESEHVIRAVKTFLGLGR